ncbi:M15 family metallopeptidase [Litoribrevibacter albus]|uniref:D-alanyl-D-alanine carboxypeptidase-like core domain-containing protein n=1 Tax=Litoribrevibacter albus TaxID=1473156 RepID=A0AA37SBS7_9GAMM|nr:M15 family metallopeptidase [Litoribrevibacter albus]GLQ33060.1 hypothetical protein GCM10007876_35390 [Litoribrevibacter albus]
MGLDKKIQLSRRKFLEYATSASAVAFGSAYTILKHGNSQLPDNSTTSDIVAIPEQPEIITPPQQPIIADASQAIELAERQRMLEKVQRFDEDLEGDIWLTEQEWKVLKSAYAKIERVKSHIGYGHFNIVSFDDMLKFAKSVPSIGEFSKTELALLEGFFYRDAKELGFMGTKVVGNLTNQIKQSQVTKVPGSGHYLFKGDSVHLLETLQKKVGHELILTSGVRSVVKQYQLYFRKVIDRNGNLSRASRSLAPPGYSFHASGDFDVGQRGYGKLNFTKEFENSHVYKELSDLGMIRIRYTADNMLGVRYEPWHIQMV